MRSTVVQRAATIPRPSTSPRPAPAISTVSPPDTIFSAAGRRAGSWSSRPKPCPTITDPTDYFTTTHFSDAASATILYGRDLGAGHWARLRRPVIGARGEEGKALRVDLKGEGRVGDGWENRPDRGRAPNGRVALPARATKRASGPRDLDLVIPHQGSHTMINGPANETQFV